MGIEYPKGGIVAAVGTVAVLVVAASLTPRTDHFLARTALATPSSSAAGEVRTAGDSQAEGVAADGRAGDAAPLSTGEGSRDDGDGADDKESQRQEENGKKAGSRKSEVSDDATAASAASGQESDSVASTEGEAESPDATSYPSFWAKHDLFNYAGHDDGSINEWAPGYYDAHDWSEAGQAIHASYPGDVIIIDGMPIRIVSREYASEHESYESIRGRLGNDVVIFQTCAEGDQMLLLSGACDGYGPFDPYPPESTGLIPDEAVTYVNELGEFATYEEAEAAMEEYVHQQLVAEASVSGTIGGETSISGTIGGE